MGYPHPDGAPALRDGGGSSSSSSPSSSSSSGGGRRHEALDFEWEEEGEEDTLGEQVPVPEEEPVLEPEVEPV